ncbi:patatin-like phospholipase family protein [Aquicoccus sp. SCR17]|nr:patatin-like phospholipase family protein [Carideicomes alvinocaridis]
MIKRINLALQGGGAHGAFTWGVLDRLLEDERLEIAGVSGTSAGAVNGAALKAGYSEGGRDGARDRLDWLWERIGARRDAALPDWMGLPDAVSMSRGMDYSPLFQWTEGVGRLFSPYASGPFYTNPLRPVVEDLDFDRVCDASGPALHICATNVRSGKVRVFAGQELSVDVILASACLPTMFRAVEIPDPLTGRTEAYWDGGYTGNPALFPLFAPQLPEDILIVNINPLERDEVPRTPQDIRNRINEISFNSSLLREMRAISFVQRLIDGGTLAEGAMKRPRMHMIHDDPLMNALTVATKMIPLPAVMAQLKEAGRTAAENFLEAHYDDLGARDSVDLQEMYS